MKIDARTRHSFFPFLFFSLPSSRALPPNSSIHLSAHSSVMYLNHGTSKEESREMGQRNFYSYIYVPVFFFSIRRSHSREMVVKIIIFSISSLAYSNRAQCTSICVYISSVRYSIYRCIRCVLDVAKRAYSRKQILKRKKRKRSRR